MFEGVVRGYEGLGWSGCGMVVVEVDPDVEVPTGTGFRELGRAIRSSDGLEIQRAIGCVGDWRPCRDIAEALEDVAVAVDLDDMGLLPVFYRLDDPPAWAFGQDPMRCEQCGSLLEENEPGDVTCPRCD